MWTEGKVFTTTAYSVMCTSAEHCAISNINKSYHKQQSCDGYTALAIRIIEFATEEWEIAIKEKDYHKAYGIERLMFTDWIDFLSGDINMHVVMKELREMYGIPDDYYL